MPNLSNYNNIFLTFYVCCDISENNGLILFMCGAVINHNRDLMHIKCALRLPKCSIYVHYIKKFSDELFMLCTVINHHRGFMHINYTLVLCHNMLLMPILS